MQLAHDLVVSAPVYQPIWKVPRSEGAVPADIVPVVHIAAESSLRLKVEAELRDRGIVVTEHLATDDLACRQDSHRPACAVIDVDMHSADVSSIIAANARKDNPPVILVGECDEPRTLVRAMKSGAFDFLPKPLDIREVLNAILSAIDQDRRQAPKRLEEKCLRARMAFLTPREREVLPLVIGGLLNKQAASLLGISEITLQIHRGQVMRKMQATSLADLVRMSMRLRVRHWRPTA